MRQSLREQVRLLYANLIRIGASDETKSHHCRGSSREPKQLICCRHLYVLYNNYIYNVYKDGKYRLEGGA